MTTKIWLVKGMYESYSNTDCVTEGVYSTEEKAVERYNALVNEVKERIKSGELDNLTLGDVHECNHTHTNANGETHNSYETEVVYDDLTDRFMIECLNLDDEEDTYTYVVFAEVHNEDNDTSDVIGVYSTEEEAKKVAKSEIDDRYAYDLEESYNNDEESLEMRPTSSNGWEYHSNYDFYNVEVSVYRKPLNERDINLRDL